MKKIIFTLLAFAFFIVSANAQESSIGIKGGVNFANLATGDDYDAAFEDNKTKLGFHAGLFFNLKITDFFALQPEILYSLQGVKFDLIGGDELKYNLSYINVPVLAKIYFGENFNIHAGPYAGFLVNTGVKVDGNTFDEDALEDAYKTFDFGVSGGIEFGAASGLVIGARYNLGLADIRDNDSEVFDVNDSDDRITNQVIQIYAGIGL